MKRISLNKIFDCLKNESNEIKIGHNIAAMARKSVQRMSEIGR
jgi:quinolinate synthase